jgi:UDP-glucose 4-epimerase
VKILILGGAGFLGNNLVRYCLRQGENHLEVVDSLDSRLGSTKDSLADVWDRIHFIQGDICDHKLMRQLVKGQDVVFNCAAQTSHTLSLSDPLFDAEINCLGNLNLLEAVRKENGSAVVVYPSTSSVVGKAETALIDETHHEQPLDIYSAHKCAAEKQVQIYSNVHNLNTVVLRFANLYGPYGKPWPEFGFLNYFISLANEGREITVYGAGGQTRNVMFVEDACEIMYQSAATRDLLGGVFFATHEEHLSVSQIAEKIVEAFPQGRVVETEWPEARRRIEIASVMFSSAKLRKITGWRPKFSFAEGLDRTKSIMRGCSQV